MPSPNRPRVRYAQNFLSNPCLVDRLLDRSTIGPDDLVLEIGPGAGAITDRLARRARRVIAVERDPAFARLDARRFADDPRVAVHCGDFFALPLPNEPYKVFASIPFNQTAAIVSRLTRATRPPDDGYLVVQQEAAERFCGVPRTTLYALLLAPWFEASVLHRFRRCDFAPPPAVDAVLLRLAKRGPPLVCDRDRDFYRDLVVTLFIARRPSLAATLRELIGAQPTMRALAAADIACAAHPSEIPISAWLRLYAALLCQRSRLEPRVHGAERRLLGQQATLHKLHRTRRAVSGPGPPCRAVYSAPSARRSTLPASRSRRCSTIPLISGRSTTRARPASRTRVRSRRPAAQWRAGARVRPRSCSRPASASPCSTWRGRGA